ncbi:antiviral reverse transcriptase Drt3a [Paracoccaceae bacterium Fryx2]|nr:antiviral reverse transcriptase Drt3a [Paracoccaceae bacterium Fryx2]
MHSFAYTQGSFDDFYKKLDRAKYGIADRDAFRDRVNILRGRINSLDFPYHFKIFKSKSRTLCTPADYETTILVRKVNSDFNRVAKIANISRSETIKSIKCMCSEEVPYTVVRLDIRRFYDSINIDHLISVVSHATRHTYALRRNIEAFLRWSRVNIGGVPTGLSLSASLAEFYLRQEFDEKVRQIPGVNFYTRYVDDIILVCLPGKSGADYIAAAESLLPLGLKFNDDPIKKTFVELRSAEAKGTFEYLGYSFLVGGFENTAEYKGRKVLIDIAKSKIDRRKTRFVKSLLQFLKDGSENDLKRRHLLINSGYTYRDAATDCVISAGICNTYSEIDFPSNALLELNEFYKFCLVGKKFPLRPRLKMSHLSSSAVRTMLSLDPNKHVQLKKYISFTASELTNLTRCWRDA